MCEAPQQLYLPRTSQPRAYTNESWCTQAWLHVKHPQLSLGVGLRRLVPLTEPPELATAGHATPVQLGCLWIETCSHMAHLSQNHLPLPRQAAHQAGQTPLGSTAWSTQFVLPAQAMQMILSMQPDSRADSQALTQALALPALALA